MRWKLWFRTALMLGAAAPVAAQSAGRRLTVGLSLGTISFSGTTETIEARNDDLRAMPFRPTMWGVTVSYGAPRFRVGLAAAYGQPGLAVRGNPSATPEASGDELLLVVNNAFRLTAVAATISTRLRQFPAGPSLRPSLGVLLERWSTPGDPTKTVIGAQAGLHLEVPLSRSLAAVVGGDVGFSPGSPFLEQVLPEGFKRRSSWRRILAAGVVLGL